MRRAPIRFTVLGLVILTAAAAYARVSEATPRPRAATVRARPAEDARRAGAERERRVAELAAELRDAQGQHQIEVIDAIARFGRGAERAIPALVETMAAAQSERAREHSAAVLANMGHPAASALAALVTESEAVRPLAARALGAMGAEAVPALMTVLEDEDAEVRRVAAHVLGHLGPVAVPATDLLEQALEDEDVLVSLAAHDALELIGS